MEACSGLGTAAYLSLVLSALVLCPLIDYFSREMSISMVWRAWDCVKQV